jgi:hypothetical protein
MGMAAVAPPLCPAGHLPLKGGDRLVRHNAAGATTNDAATLVNLMISPLEGEMSGRTEGGAVERFRPSSARQPLHGEMHP